MSCLVEEEVIMVVVVEGLERDDEDGRDDSLALLLAVLS